MIVTIFTAEGCGACDAAKKKLALLGVEHRKLDVFDAADDVIDALRANENAVPLFEIDGELMGYPAAMKRLKGVACAAS